MAGPPPGPPAQAAAPATKRQIARATAAEREAALRLGFVYESLAAARDLPLDARSLPLAAAPVTHPPVLSALYKVFGTDTERDRKRGTGRYVSASDLYKKDFDALIRPRLHQAVLDYTMTSLTAEELELGRLVTKIEQEPGLAETLHTLADEAIKEAGGLEPTDQEVWESYDTQIPAPTTPMWNYRTQKLEMVTTGAEQRRDLNEKKLAGHVRNRLAPKVYGKNNAVMSTLFLHRRGVDIVERYAKSAAEGTSYAAARVRYAQQSVLDFRRELTERENKDHVWRYEPLVRGGVQALGLTDVAGFPEYALGVGRFLSRSDAESFVNFASIAVACLGLIFTGPVGAAVIAAADLSLAATSQGLNYLRESEQELASHASGFRKDDEKFAASSDYGETMLAGAATLLCGLAFFKSLGPLRQVLRAEGAVVKVATKAPVSVTKDLAASEARLVSKEARLASEESRLASEEARLVDGKALNKVDEAAATTKAPAAGAKKPLGKGERTPAKAPAKPAAPPVKKTMGQRSPETLAGKPPKADFEPIADAERGLQEKRVGEALGEAEPRLPLESDPLQGDRAYREGIRKGINKQIETLEEEIRKIRRQQASVDKNIALANKQRAAARQAGDAKRLATVEARWQTLVNERPTVGTLGHDVAALRQALRGTEADYYALLTARAARELSYLEVAAGVADDRFLPLAGKYSVEHIVARSEIFLIPGFERLTPQQQSWLFSYRRALIKIPAAANSARLNRAYSSLPPSFASKFMRSPKGLEEMARLQADLRTELRTLVANPHLIPNPAVASGPVSVLPTPNIASPLTGPAEALPGDYRLLAPDSWAPISPVTDPTLVEGARGTGELFGPPVRERY